MVLDRLRNSGSVLGDDGEEVPGVDVGAVQRVPVLQDVFLLAVDGGEGGWGLSDRWKRA